MTKQNQNCAEIYAWYKELACDENINDMLFLVANTCINVITILCVGEVHVHAMLYVY